MENDIMLDSFLFSFIALVGGIILYCIDRKKLRQRIEILEEDLERYSEVMSKMAEVQSKTFDKFTDRFNEVDERVLDLSVPSQSPEIPLEKRHQVLTLAKRGVPLDEIVERVNAPVGEAELILNLRKYQNGMQKNTSSPKQAAGRM